MPLIGNRIILILKSVPRGMMVLQCGAVRPRLPTRGMVASVDGSERLTMTMTTSENIRGAGCGCRCGTSRGVNGVVNAPELPRICTCGALQSAQAG